LFTIASTQALVSRGSASISMSEISVSRSGIEFCRISGFSAMSIRQWRLASSVWPVCFSSNAESAL
jgi:hypothetical protein